MPEAWAGVVAVIEVAPTTVTPVAAIAELDRGRAGEVVPVIVTAVPPAAGPRGLTPVTVGAAT